jgi:hypothetical protein
MNHKDDELNELLKPLRGMSPDNLQMQKWQTAIQSEVGAGRTIVTTTRTKWAFQLVAAMFVGFVMGAIVIKSLSPFTGQNPNATQISVNNATFEHSHANLD